MKRILISVSLLAISAVSYFNISAQSSERHDAAGTTDVPKQTLVAGGKAIVPMEIYGRKPVVEVKINDKGPFKFFLDTGAGATVIDQKLADELKLPTNGTTKIGDPSDPQGITANRDEIDKLEVGGTTFNDLIAVSWDRSPLYKDGAPRGVLGMPLFRELLLSIDYPKSQVSISKGTLPAADGKNIIEYQFSENDLFSIPVKVGSVDMLATLDTGSPGGLSFPNEYMDRLPLDGKPTEIGKARTVSGESIIYGAKLKGSITLGRTTFENPNVAFFSRLTHLNIGFGLISQFAITIDQKNRRMGFAKTQASPADGPAPYLKIVKGSNPTEYSGLYGQRRITVENGGVYLQRIAGPQGVGPKLKLTEVSKDAYSIAGSDTVRVKFLRNSHGDIKAVQVLTPDGDWETSEKLK